jgi:hypothetical protein
LLKAPAPHARDEWIALRHLAVHWAPHLDGMSQDTLAARLLTAAEKGEVPVSALRIAQDGRSDEIEHIGGLRGLIERAAAQGIPRLQFVSDLVEERHLTLIFHRDGVLTFAELYGFPPPPWWTAVPAAASAQKPDGAKRRPGRDPDVRARVKADMRAFIERESLTALQNMKVAAMERTFGASRDTCRNALSELLAENSDR